jgi:hypothetical protein
MSASLLARLGLAGLFAAVMLHPALAFATDPLPAPPRSSAPT